MVSDAIKAGLIQSALDMLFRLAVLVWTFGLNLRVESCMIALGLTAISKRIRELRVLLRRGSFFYLLLPPGAQNTRSWEPITLWQLNTVQLGALCIKYWSLAAFHCVASLVKLTLHIVSSCTQRESLQVLESNLHYNPSSRFHTHFFLGCNWSLKRYHFFWIQARG